MDGYGWRNAVIVFAVFRLLVLPLCLVVATPRAEDASASPSAARAQTYRQALAEAFGHRSYLLLVLGFFTCGPICSTAGSRSRSAAGRSR